MDYKIIENTNIIQCYLYEILYGKYNKTEKTFDIDNSEFFNSVGIFFKNNT